MKCEGRRRPCTCLAQHMPAALAPWHAQRLRSLYDQGRSRECASGRQPRGVMILKPSLILETWAAQMLLEVDIIMISAAWSFSAAPGIIMICLRCLPILGMASLRCWTRRATPPDAASDTGRARRRRPTALERDEATLGPDHHSTLGGSYDLGGSSSSFVCLALSRYSLRRAGAGETRAPREARDS